MEFAALHALLSSLANNGVNEWNSSNTGIGSFAIFVVKIFSIASRYGLHGILLSRWR
jgi:hypothetical protein